MKEITLGNQKTPPEYEVCISGEELEAPPVASSDSFSTLDHYTIIWAPTQGCGDHGCWGPARGKGEEQIANGEGYEGRTSRFWLQEGFAGLSSDVPIGLGPCQLLRCLFLPMCGPGWGAWSHRKVTQEAEVRL